MKRSNVTITDAGPSAPVANETLSQVLVERLRGLGTSELRMTAVGGAINATLIWTQFAGLRWLACGFIAAASYGAWGLLDRKIATLVLQNREKSGTMLAARVTRVAIGTVGWAGALYAAAVVFTDAMRTFGFPGT